MRSQHMFTRHAGAMSGWTVALILLWTPLQSAAAVPPESLLVYADQIRRPLELRAGFLHGWQDPDPLNDSMVALLKPRQWRLYKYYNYETARDFNAAITFNISDSYAFSEGGYPVANPWDDWAGYEAFIRAYIEFYRAEFPDNLPEFYDIWNEPDHSFFWHGTYEQALELYARAHALIKDIDSTAKTVGPSISWFRPGLPGIPGIIDFLVDLDSIYGVRFDAIAWHENGGAFAGGPRPENLYFNALWLRDTIEALFPPEYTPEYHVNEFNGTQEHLSPGFSAGYLFYIEAAQIDAAMRACWNIYSVDSTTGPYAWTDCWAGLNGMFMRDGTTPLATFWVHHAYAQMEGDQVLATNISTWQTTCLASLNDSTESINMLIGRYYHFDTVDVGLRVIDFPWDYPRALVTIKRIPHREELYTNPPLAIGMPNGPELISSQNVDVVDSSVYFILDDYAEGDAYIVSVSAPACDIELPGDLDASGVVTSGDIIAGVNFVFKSGSAPIPCEAAGDINCSGAVTSADVISLVNYVFKGGAAPCDVCTSSLPAECY